VKDRPRAAAVRQRHLALQGGLDVRIVSGTRRVADPVPDQRRAVPVAGEQAVIGSTRIVDHQPGRVGVAGQISDVHFAGAQELVDQGEHEQAVGAGGDGEPLVGDRRIAGAHRVDRDELDAFALEQAQPDLERVGIVVLGAAEQHEVAGVLPVGLAELPERAADRVDAAGRHVDRAEAAVGGVVGRAELRGPPAGQRLALIAAGEERELAGIVVADRREPLGRGRERLVPLDLAELASAALADPQQRLGEARGRVVLHDSGRALGAQHAMVDRVVAVALDVADAAVLQVHFDAAAAGAHVAGRGLDLVGDRRRQIERAHEQNGPPRGRFSSMACSPAAGP
jgi:hypothetical protein